MELNPKHPVTREAHNHWHKIAALLVLRTGQKKVVIPTSEIMKLEGLNITIRFDDAIGIELTLVDGKEAIDLLRKEGGY